MKPTQNCAYHPSQQIINFCKNQNCLMFFNCVQSIKNLQRPLCAECIKIHTQEHSENRTYGQFETIDNVSDECKKQMQILKSKFELKQENLKDMAKSMNNLEGELLKKLHDSKDKFFELVESHFKSLEMEIKSKHQICKKQCQNQIEQENTNIQRKSQEIDSIIQKLNGKSFLKQIITLLRSSYLEDSLNYEMEINQQMNLLNSEMLDILVDESKLYSINVELAKYITVKNAAAILISKQNENYGINERSQWNQINLAQIPFDNKSEISQKSIGQSKFNQNLLNQKQFGQAIQYEKPNQFNAEQPYSQNISRSVYNQYQDNQDKFLKSIDPNQQHLTYEKPNQFNAEQPYSQNLNRSVYNQYQDNQDKFLKQIDPNQQHLTESNYKYYYPYQKDYCTEFNLQQKYL